MAERAFPVSFAQHVPTTVRFYEAFGFERHFQLPPDGEPGYVGLRRGSYEIAVVSSDWPQQQYDATVGRGVRFEMFIYLAEVDDVVEQLRGEGIESINALADQAPGFIWRLRSHPAEHVSLADTTGDPLLIINLSVWCSYQHLHEFTYRSTHMHYLRRRAEWFTRIETPATVLWWIKSGHLPTPDEALAHLQHLRRYGATPQAFTVRNRFDPAGRREMRAPHRDTTASVKTAAPHADRETIVKRYKIHDRLGTRQGRSRRITRRCMLLAVACVLATTRKPARSNMGLVPTKAIVKSIRPGGSTG